MTINVRVGHVDDGGNILDQQLLAESGQDFVGTGIERHEDDLCLRDAIVAGEVELGLSTPHQAFNCVGNPFVVSPLDGDERRVGEDGAEGDPVGTIGRRWLDLGLV